jgi:putative SOS response-associated peptidase YedK
MCNLYSQTRNVEAIRRLFRISDNRTSRIDPQPAIFPGWTAPVIRKAEDGKRELVAMNSGWPSQALLNRPATKAYYGYSVIAFPRC